MPIPNTNYTDEFYTWQSVGSYQSAQIVSKIVHSIYTVNSVIDIGCGIGTWLRAFKENGTEKIVGFDGSWVSKQKLMINQNEFHQVDLSSNQASYNEKFDLCISLEVAEHLPESMAEKFIESLCNKSDIILFSAAIPYQGGTDHINEQWQSYWAKMFIKHEFTPFDVIRPAIRGNNLVEWWYQQNIILYIKNNHPLYQPLSSYSRNPSQLDYACRTLFDGIAKEAFQPKLRRLLKKIPPALSHDFKRKIFNPVINGFFGNNKPS